MVISFKEQHWQNLQAFIGKKLSSCRGIASIIATLEAKKTVASNITTAAYIFKEGISSIHIIQITVHSTVPHIRNMLQ
jgi:hypothetical protein